MRKPSIHTQVLLFVPICLLLPNACYSYGSTRKLVEFNDIMLPSPPSAFALLRAPRNLASQFELATQMPSPDHPTCLSRKGSKAWKSWIKRHGLFVIEIDTNDSLLSPYWACRLCDAKGQPEFFAAAATSSAADYLRRYEDVIWRA
ncbi:putative oxidoreductase YhdF [Fusarium oxysporum f. sp. albedinis]|nr:putative oxidoreductase YhdF [Fusarium oxysporum f. sp. albedinis]